MCELLDKYWNDGVATGTFSTLVSLVKQGLLQVVDAAKQLDITEEEFKRRMNQSV